MKRLILLVPTVLVFFLTSFIVGGFFWVINTENPEFFIVRFLAVVVDLVATGVIYVNSDF